LLGACCCCAPITALKQVPLSTLCVHKQLECLESDGACCGFFAIELALLLQLVCGASDLILQMGIHSGSTPPTYMKGQLMALRSLSAAACHRSSHLSPLQVPLSTPSVLKQLEGLESGGAVALLDEEAAQQLGLATDEAGSGALAANAPLAVSVWRTRASLSVLVGKNECEQMADKLRNAQQQMKQQQGGKGKAAAVAAAAAAPGQ
jgi:hypothetical protein